MALVGAIFLLAIGCTVGGVYVLAGPGWALISTGVLLAGVGVLLRRELSING